MLMGDVLWIPSITEHPMQLNEYVPLAVMNALDLGLMSVLDAQSPTICYRAAQVNVSGATLIPVTKTESLIATTVEVLLPTFPLATVDLDSGLMVTTVGNVETVANDVPLMNKLTFVSSERRG